MKRIQLEKADRLLLESFVEARIPQFYKDIGLACSTTEYLVGLTFRCLKRDPHLTFELSLLDEDEKELDEIVARDYPDTQSTVFRMQMKIAYLLLNKYYNKDGSAKSQYLQK